MGRGILSYWNMMFFLLISFCGMFMIHADSAAQLTLPITGRLELPNGDTPPANQEIVLNGGAYKTLSRIDGKFTFYGIPSGIYLLDVGSIDYMYPQMKLKVSAENASVIAVEYKYPGAKRQSAMYPLLLKAITRVRYFQKKKQLSIIGMITGNPMMIMMAISLVAVLLMPKMLQGMSPEELAELKKQSGSGDPMKELSKLMGMGDSKKDDDDDDD